jgi:hypothetical protein
MADLIGIKFGDDDELSYVEVVHGILDNKTTVYGFEGSTDTYRKTLPTTDFQKSLKQGEAVMKVTLK